MCSKCLRRYAKILAARRKAICSPENHQHCRQNRKISGNMPVASSLIDPRKLVLKTEMNIAAANFITSRYINLGECQFAICSINDVHISKVRVRIVIISLWLLISTFQLGVNPIRIQIFAFWFGSHSTGPVINRPNSLRLMASQLGLHKRYSFRALFFSPKAISK